MADGLDQPTLVLPALPDASERTGLLARLRARIAGRTAHLGVVGLGYVGLPLIRAMNTAGFRCTGFDTDAEKVRCLNTGRSYMRSISDDVIAAMCASGRFAATDAFADVKTLDAIVVCVPTPLTANREPDLSFITRTAESLAAHLRPGQLVVLESTTYPGTTAEVLVPILERSGLRIGDEVFVAYSPEREDPGNPSFTTTTIPKVVGSDDPATTEAACDLYRQFVGQVVPVSSLRVAEAVKLTENIFRAVNIALVNELKLVYDELGVDIWEVIDAAKTKPFGFMAFYPGPGLGGHCIPIDPFYLTWKAREHGITTRFIELAGEINTNMPRYVVERLALALDQRFSRGLKGSSILIVGLAYKKNVDDTRESPALAIMDMLVQRGANVAYHDPFVPSIPRTRRYRALQGRQSVELSPEMIASFDAALIVTDHDDIDYEGLVRSARLVVDTRNATRAVREGRQRILRA